MSAAQVNPETPLEIWCRIVSYLEDDRDVARFSAVCKLFKAAVDMDSKMRLRRLGIDDFAFGKAKWTKYFGDIGEEPPLPANIEEILDSPCPIWDFSREETRVRQEKVKKRFGRHKTVDVKYKVTVNGNKKVRDTHMLTLIPSHIDGKPLTLEYLGEIVKSPKGGGRASEFKNWLPGGNEKTQAPKNYWTLMTKDVIPGSRNKKYKDQCKLLSRYDGYEVPRIYEAAISIFMEHARSGQRLHSDMPFTYTRCQETYKEKSCEMVVGGFGAEGLCVYAYCYAHDYHGLGGVRKFL